MFDLASEYELDDNCEDEAVDTAIDKMCSFVTELENLLPVPLAPICVGAQYGKKANVAWKAAVVGCENNMVGYKNAYGPMESTIVQSCSVETFRAIFNVV